MANFSQRDPVWSNQRLGTCDGVTIGSDGCYVTAFANIASHFGKDVNPGALDDGFTSRGLYVQGCLCLDDMLTRVYPDIQYEGTFHFEDRPADFSVLNNNWEDEYVIELDFNPNQPGVQTHFSRFYDYFNGVLRIIDSWTGQLTNVADVYGDPAVAVQKIVHYRGPTQVAPTPPPPPVAVNPEPPAPHVNTDVPVVTPPSNEVVPPPVDPLPDSALHPDAVQTRQEATNPSPVNKIREEVGKVVIPERLKSRKFWVAVVGILFFALHGQTQQAFETLLAYLGVQGVVDTWGTPKQ